MFVLKSKILNSLLDAHYFLTMDEIINDSNITRRTFFYQLNNWLVEDLNLEPVESIRNIGYFLPEKTKKALNTEINLKPQLSIKNRQNNIIFMMISNQKPLSLSYLSNFYQVSKKTIISDLKTIKSNLTTKLNMETSNKGHLISGYEQEKRRLIFKLIETIDLKQFNHFDQKIINTMLFDFEKATGNKLSKYSHLLLTSKVSKLVFPSHFSRT